MSMLHDEAVYLGTSFLTADDGTQTSQGEYLPLSLANRHGLITGRNRHRARPCRCKFWQKVFPMPAFLSFVPTSREICLGWAAKGGSERFLAKRAETIGLTEEYNFASIQPSSGSVW